ncbi:uncharacterized protein K489DRAFT_200732 [Dissoconium aciculare CBS 342.82]|uniref:Uncharacterized protein n=1 Tax=Dissoconium aciculare CBS 342.82 TaxID=1314786 RepID=A0A6J3M9W0_9PEZI|nr:uncharacterized protein K489DRAFT_200732 [Dissoconium aciculare CBS 342.82]KAF1823597.1 hypothetical protein K489DRAFT_200732 [Dissoconium aciculare CBS 342.82]
MDSQHRIHIMSARFRLWLRRLQYGIVVFRNFTSDGHATSAHAPKLQLGIYQDCSIYRRQSRDASCQTENHRAAVVILRLLWPSQANDKWIRKVKCGWGSYCRRRGIDGPSACKCHASTTCFSPLWNPVATLHDGCPVLRGPGLSSAILPGAYCFHVPDPGPPK